MSPFEEIKIIGQDEEAKESKKEGESKMAIFSDGHIYEKHDPLHKELEGKNTSGEKLIARSQENNEKKFILTLEEAKKIGDIDMLFFGGDMVTGYGERGSIGPDSPKQQ